MALTKYGKGGKITSTDIKKVKGVIESKEKKHQIEEDAQHEKRKDGKEKENATSSDV